MGARQEIKLALPALPDYVGIARTALAAILNRYQASPAAIEELKVAVCEACTNAVRYAYPQKPGEIEICFRLERRNFTVIVRDAGRGFNTRRPPRRPIKDEDIHLGLGLTLMRSMVDKLKIQSGVKGTTVTLIKKI